MELLILAFGCGIPLYVLWALFSHFTTSKKKASEPLIRPSVTAALTRKDEPEDFDAWLDSFGKDESDDIPPYMWWD